MFSGFRNWLFLQNRLKFGLKEMLGFSASEARHLPPAFLTGHLRRTGKACRLILRYASGAGFEVIFTGGKPCKTEKKLNADNGLGSFLLTC